MTAAPTTTSSHANPLRSLEHAMTWLGENWIEVAIAVAIGIAIYFALGLLKRIVQRLLLKAAHSAPIMGAAASTVGKTGHLFMMLIAARLVVNYFPVPPALFNAINFLFIVVTAWQIAVWVRHMALGFIQMRSDPELGGSEALANASGLIKVLLSIAIFAVAAIVVLDNLGVNVTGLVAGLGIGGIAIGLAAQGIFSDLFASLSIIFDKPFKVGDAINFGTQTGVVERIGLKSTRLRVVTGERMIVSNAQLLNKEITSYTGLDRRRIKFAIGVIYQTAPAEAAKIPDLLREIVNAHGGDFVRSGFIGFGASSLDFELEFDVHSADWDKIYMIRHAIGLDILGRFNDLGLEFAYPTQTTFTADPSGKMIMPYPVLHELPGALAPRSVGSADQATSE
ncbi:MULTISPECIES: mechanosensitive ion channel family protein [unclassified Sphingobium]|uniref:mechanosensitive ion channel family protein n=1 Tax=unclassified Sphingobium TaxID=2611147 RepID=UPI002225833D|nr:MULTISPECIES: mechanosensitive ion channel family protein [unclassified Sphingobium]MCW2412088.1 small-conductance mechanosensitive channel [Sphingobium sp. B8D3D]MCW2415615.1 small-conductance mechanosensitive channel [Sphingobium sp. B8D3A]